MPNLARSRDLPDLLVSIELKLVALGWAEVRRGSNRRRVWVSEPRLIDWAIACCQKSIPSEIIAALAENRPPEQRWWVLRQMLPDAALHVLDGKLDLFLNGGDRH